MLSCLIVLTMTAPIAVLSFIVGALVARIDRDVERDLEARDTPHWVSLI